ncbi:BMC domain-containing protein [Enterococcus plantarum]|uniref:BMC domain-containing protein n=1 Tax=Enterococcus plantarum TaxID=1077675 RepID=UPI001A8C3C95|nr:BMC domain-containing protein [Enterococcus plantarum]MBO0422146.1 BMC domain-containing protein [Enterococcus plantarum]
MNQAIGMIETRGLLALIESTDAMLKSSEVHCLGKKQVGGGLNTVLITGDVAAVETAIQAAIASVQYLGEGLLAGSHVIPRPDIDAFSFVEEVTKIEEIKALEPEEERIEIVEVKEMVELEPKEKVLNELQQMKVTELRKLAKEQPNFSIPQKNIHRANKEKLIKALMDSLIINE